MTDAVQTGAGDFTMSAYRGLLVEALVAGYDITSIRDFSEASPHPKMILRHDLDFTLEIAEMAETEAELGLSATYFVQTACAHYNLLAPEGRHLMRHLDGLGHEVGLHYDAARYVGPNGRHEMVSDIRLLEDLSGQTIVSAAQHIPTDGAPVDLSELIKNDAYEPRFTAAPMDYVSDSIMTWRQARPEEMIARRASFQFLTHPENWSGHANIGQTLTSIAERNARSVQRLYAETVTYLEMLLAERDQRDATFRKQRGWSDPEG